jgi:hypothetical protein
MSAVWTIVGVAVFGVVAAVVARVQGRGKQVDLGVVSNTWVAEHRLSQTHDSQR